MSCTAGNAAATFINFLLGQGCHMWTGLGQTPHCSRPLPSLSQMLPSGGTPFHKRFCASILKLGEPHVMLRLLSLPKRCYQVQPWGVNNRVQFNRSNKVKLFQLQQTSDCAHLNACLKRASGGTMPYCFFAQHTWRHISPKKLPLAAWEIISVTWTRWNCHKYNPPTQTEGHIHANRTSGALTKTTPIHGI